VLIFFCMTNHNKTLGSAPYHGFVEVGDHALAVIANAVRESNRPRVFSTHGPWNHMFSSNPSCGRYPDL
jgi:hypothetical protein